MWPGLGNRGRNTGWKEGLERKLEPLSFGQISVVVGVRDVIHEESGWRRLHRDTDWMAPRVRYSGTRQTPHTPPSVLRPPPDLPVTLSLLPPPFVHLLSRAFVLSGLLDDSCTVARINCSSRNWSWSLLCSIRGWKISATVRADASPAEKLPPSTVGELEREEKILSTWLFSTRENVRRSIFYLV